MRDQPTIGTAAALHRVFKEAPELRRGLAVTATLATVGSGIQLVVPIVVQQIVDFELLDPEGVDVSGATTRAVVAVIAMAIAMYVRGIALVRLAVRSAGGLSELRVKAFEHLHRLSVLHVEAEHRGTLVARVTSDISTVQDFMDWGGVGMLVGSAQVVLAMAAMVFYGWQLALVVAAGAVVYAGLLVWFQKILQRSHDTVRLRVGDSLGAMGESISGLPTIRAYGAEASTVASVDSVLDAQFRAEHRAMKLGAALFSSAELFAGIITAAVVGVGVVIGPSTGLSAGTLLAFLFLVVLLVDPIQTLVETLDQAQSAAAGIRRIIDVLDTPIDIADPGTEGTRLPETGLAIRFDDVWFRYPTGDDVIAGVDLEIAAGSRVAIVGETGSGKSTFAKLATRLLDPAKGEVRIGGVPLKHIPFENLRSRVAFVPQEGFLFDTSVANNARYGNPGATDAEVHVAFEELGLEDWVMSLPGGIDTPVGERGDRLSAGERQLIALVRAWISHPDVLVLDEATSAVDPALEVRLRRAIERLTKNMTSLTVAHRLSTAESSDEILVFDHGAVVERGSHAELLAAAGLYSALHADWAAGIVSGGGVVPAS